MQVNLDFNHAAYTIRRYERGSITVQHPLVDPDHPDAPIQRDTNGRPIFQEEVFTRSLILMPQTLIRDWPPQSFAELAAESLNVLLGYPLEIILLGTGARQQFPGLDVTRLFMQKGIGVEVMDTAAACRTYNILMTDGRGVAAALIND
ncbi:MAG: Mth938-like domain-containing protein [Pseudomonadota bacterium]